MPGRILAAGAALCSLLGLGAAALSPSVASAAAPATRYYLALGDSLSQGVQPNTAGESLETAQGYANDLFAFESARIPTLTLVDLGCPGESTGSMLTGNGNATAAGFFHCDRKGGSQLKAAELFLKAHHRRGEVPLVTLDIGANDVDGCAAVPASQIGTCVSTGEASIRHDLPLILRGLKKAAPAGTAFAAMTLYDPVLGNYFSADSTQRSLATASVPLTQQVNNDLTSADAAAGFKTADVAGAFDTYDTTDMVSWESQMIPIDVARVCSWTWACTTPPSGPNIHANKNGYAVIAGAFKKVVGRLH
jgi:lysophospholipase L1-like esterase